MWPACKEQHNITRSTLRTEANSEVTDVDINIFYLIAIVRWKHVNAEANNGQEQNEEMDGA